MRKRLNKDELKLLKSIKIKFIFGILISGFALGLSLHLGINEWPLTIMSFCFPFGYETVKNIKNSIKNIYKFICIITLGIFWIIGIIVDFIIAAFIGMIMIWYDVYILIKLLKKKNSVYLQNNDKNIFINNNKLKVNNISDDELLMFEAIDDFNKDRENENLNKHYRECKLCDEKIEENEYEMNDEMCEDCFLNNAYDDNGDFIEDEEDRY